MPGPKTQAQQAINAPHVPGGTAPLIRQPAHPSAGLTQPREKMAGRPRLTTLKVRDKPAGSAGRGQSDNAGEEQASKKKRAGYNLQETLSLSEKQYKIAWAVVKIMCGKYLDTTKSFEAQNSSAVMDCMTHIRFELDEFEAFNDPLWPIRDFMVMILKSSANSWSALCREAKAGSNNAGSGGEINNQGGNNNDLGALDASTATAPAPSDPTPPPAATPTLAPASASAPAQPSTLAPGSAAPPALGTAPTSQPTSRPRPKPKSKAPTTGKRKRTDGPENEPEPAPESQPDDEPQPETQPGEPGAQPDEAEPQTGEPAPDSQSEAEADAPSPQDAPTPPTPPPATKGKGKAKAKSQSGPVQLTKEPIPENPPAKRQKRSDPIPDKDSESSEDEAATSAEQTKAVSGRTRAATKAANGNAATTTATTAKAATAKAKVATAKAKVVAAKKMTTRRKK
ncbi:hypothetical protein FRC08_011153 [Ceratobasidium sp. 394]|nr:hypothetical protein FRC08_011153 [Ceratobasidium sp. 394]